MGLVSEITEFRSTSTIEYTAHSSAYIELVDAELLNWHHNEGFRDQFGSVIEKKGAFILDLFCLWQKLMRQQKLTRWLVPAIGVGNLLLLCIAIFTTYIDPSKPN